MGCYGDSSFLVSCYIADRHTARAQAVLARIGEPLPFTALHELEVTNAFQQGIFRGHITADEAMAARADLAADLREGRLTRAAARHARAARESASIREGRGLGRGRKGERRGLVMGKFRCAGFWPEFDAGLEHHGTAGAGQSAAAERTTDALGGGVADRASAAGAAGGTGKKIKWPDVVARTRRIFGQKARPNLVLMERDPAAR